MSSERKVRRVEQQDSLTFTLASPACINPVRAVQIRHRAVQMMHAGFVQPEQDLYSYRFSFYPKKENMFIIDLCLLLVHLSPLTSPQ